MPKKGESQGSIYFDKRRNRFTAQYYEFDYAQNKRIKKQKSFEKESEAKLYLDSIMYQKSNPLYIKNNGIPLNQVMRANVQRKYDSNLISESQFGRVLKTIELIESSPIAKKRIEEITSDEIQGYLNSVKHYSNSYIKKIYEQFSQAYRYALNRGYIYKNPLDDVIKPKSDKKDKVVRALTVEEQKAFTEYLTNRTLEEEPYKNVFLIQMYTGARVGEVLALHTSDVRLKYDMFKVDKTLTTDGNGKVVLGNSPKTYAGKRVLPITNDLKPFMTEQMKLAEDNKREELFISPNGKYIDSRNVNRRLKKILKEQFNITDISTHSLRHTFGTRCIEAGVAPVVVQKLMGHRDISVTLNVYTTVFDKYKQSEIEKVNSYYMNIKIFPNEKKVGIDLIEKDIREEENER